MLPVKSVCPGSAFVNLLSSFVNLPSSFVNPASDVVNPELAFVKAWLAFVDTSPYCQWFGRHFHGSRVSPKYGLMKLQTTRVENMTKILNYKCMDWWNGLDLRVRWGIEQLTLLKKRKQRKLRHFSRLSNFLSLLVLLVILFCALNFSGFCVTQPSSSFLCRQRWIPLQHQES